MFLFFLTTPVRSEAAIALVTTGIGFVSGSSTNTTPMNCTGANLLVLVPVCYDNSVVSGASVTDSVGGNTWVALTEQTGVSSRHAAIWYAANANVGSSMAITFNQTCPSGMALTAACYSGVATSSSFDVQSGSSPVGNGLIYQPGNVTPSVNGELFVTGLHNNNSDLTPTVDSGFTFERQSTSGGNSHSFLADFIQGTAGAINMKWTFTGSADTSPSAIATFKPAVASGGFNKQNRLQVMED